MKNNKYVIFVLPEEFDEHHMEYSDAITWAYANLSNEYVIQLSMDDIHLLDQKALDFINEANDSMIGPYEDSWVTSQSVKQSILNNLTIYINEIPEGREKTIITKINCLLQKAIDIDHNIYFKF